MGDGGHRVLPDARLCGHIGAKVARARTHVAVGQLIPAFRKGLGQFVRIGVEMAADRGIGRVIAQREVAGQHRGRVGHAGAVRVGHGAGVFLGRPLIGARRAFGQLPLIAEPVVEKGVAPPGRGLAPGHFQPAADGVGALAGAKAGFPAKAQLLDRRGLGRGADQGGVARAMRFAKRVPARDQRDGFVIIHRDACESFADVAGAGHRIGHAVGAFRVHIDQPHLHRGQRVFQIALAGVALIAQPLAFRAPVNVLLAFPHIRAATGKAHRAQAH